MNSKSPEQFVKELRDVITAEISGLNGILEKIPEALRGDLTKLRDSLTEKLTALKPFEQVPQAEQATFALNAVMDGIGRMQEYSNLLLGKLDGMAAELAKMTTAKNDFEKKIADKELMTKDEVKAACDLARSEAENSLKPSIAGMRKQMVTAAGLPDAAEATLGLSEEDFNQQFTQAKTNLAELTKRGFKLGTTDKPGRGAALIKSSVWMEQNAFNGHMSMIEDVIGSKKPITDPLMGANGKMDDTAGDTKPMAIG